MIEIARWLAHRRLWYLAPIVTGVLVWSGLAWLLSKSGRPRCDPDVTWTRTIGGVVTIAGCQR